MGMRVKLVLYGALAMKFAPEFEVDAEEGITVGELLKTLGISTEESHILINERKVGEEQPLKNGDTVKILPVIYGG
ncbi:hypothetical protein JCM16138_02920 [Thermococcus atlanticus]